MASRNIFLPTPDQINFETQDVSDKTPLKIGRQRKTTGSLCQRVL